MPCPAAQPSSLFCSKWSAFTLLEVILALVILAGSVAVFGEVLWLADRNAAAAKAETRAQLLAATLMAEMASGMADITDKQREPIDTEDSARWVYSVTTSPVQAGDHLADLTSVEILVEQDLPQTLRPVKYRLRSWLYQSTELAPESTSTVTGKIQRSGSGHGEGTDG